MKVEHMHEGVRYTLSNENLKVKDKVYPIAWGRCLDDGSWILHKLDFNECCSGFPDDPHTILDLNYSKSKPEQVRTDFGYSPIECYYKIIKAEIQIKENGKRFSRSVWTEILLATK